MFTQERVFPIVLLAALALAVVVTFVALVHGYAGIEMLW
jgi:hypothetical protein